MIEMNLGVENGTFADNVWADLVGSRKRGCNMLKRKLIKGVLSE